MASCDLCLQLTAIMHSVVWMAILCTSPIAKQLRKLSYLVEVPSVILTYHEGPLLSTSGVTHVHFL
jgi:hypothetical protein